MSELVTRLLGTCQVCEGRFKTTQGSLVHHGYKRPGDGMIHGDCYAVGCPAYELSCEKTKQYLGEVVLPYVANVEKRLGRLERRETTWIVNPYMDRRDVYFFEEGFAMGVTVLHRFELQYESTIRATKYELESARREKARLERMIRDWSLRSLEEVHEAAEANLKAERTARSAERQAKRDAAAAKRAATKVKQEALAAKRQAILDSFREGFLSLAQEPKSHERTRRTWELVDKFKLKKHRSWLYERELKCDDALIELGLAYRQNGWTGYKM